MIFRLLFQASRIFILLILEKYVSDIPDFRAQQCKVENYIATQIFSDSLVYADC